MACLMSLLETGLTDGERRVRGCALETGSKQNDIESPDSFFRGTIFAIQGPAAGSVIPPSDS